VQVNLFTSLFFMKKFYPAEFVLVDFKIKFFLKKIKNLNKTAGFSPTSNLNYFNFSSLSKN